MLTQFSKNNAIVVLALTAALLFTSSCSKYPKPSERVYSFHVPDTVFFSVSSQTEYMTIQNTGNMPLEYTLSSSSAFVESTPSTGEIPIGETISVDITVSREALLNDPTTPTLTLTADELSRDVVISLERKDILPVDVIDIAYSKATDQFVYLGGDNNLKIYHPSTRTTDEIPLFYIPICVSLSTDGTKAAVGHDAHVSYVDLLTKTVINTHDVSCKAYEIVLADNGWAYVFPNIDSSEKIHCINLTDPNSEEVANSGTYGKVIAYQHPSSKFIYSIDESGLKKFDIQNGVIEKLYEKSAKGKEFWLSENGNRIFTSSHYVYKTSEAQALDVSYNGTISNQNPNLNYPKAQWIDQSEATKNIYLISSSYYYGDYYDNPHVFVYNSENLTYKYRINLENYYVKDSYGNPCFYSAQPFYVFSKLDGSRIYVVTQAGESEFKNSWAIQTIFIN